MSWIVNEFVCNACGHYFDDMYKRDELHLVECPACQSKDLEKQLSAPNIGAFSAMSPEFQRAAMMERSAKHTAQTLKKEPGKHGMEVWKNTRDPKVGYTPPPAKAEAPKKTSEKKK